MINAVCTAMIPDPESEWKVDALIDMAVKSLHARNDYSERVMTYMESTWNQFLTFCNESGIDMYRREHADRFILEYNKRKVPFTAATIQRRKANMKILDLLAREVDWIKGSLDLKTELAEDFMAFMEKQDQFLEKYSYSENTRITTFKQTYDILSFFEAHGLTKLADINRSHILEYVMSLKGHAKSTLRCELSRIRVILHNAYLLEFIEDDKSELVPNYRLGQPQSRIKIWTSEELNQVLSAVDRSNPKGKRDAAFIILASELGMRSKEICDLKLTDIDWESCAISFTQCKTGQPNVLPLNEKTGNAIIDYLHVRPETSCEYLFVSMNPPYDKMKMFNSMFMNYVRRSGVTVPRDSHHGLHSQRATVITRLLEAGVSADDAFSFAGHSDRESLPNYVRMDIEHLRECALSFEDGDLV